MTITYYLYGKREATIVKNVTGFVIGFDYTAGNLLYTVWYNPRCNETISLPITATVVISNGD